MHTQQISSDLSKPPAKLQMGNLYCPLPRCKSAKSKATCSLKAASRNFKGRGPSHRPNVSYLVRKRGAQSTHMAPMPPYV